MVSLLVVAPPYGTMPMIQIIIDMSLSGFILKGSKYRVNEKHLKR